jgi:hypothetical protein
METEAEKGGRESWSWAEREELRNIDPTSAEERKSERAESDSDEGLEVKQLPRSSPW